MARSCEDDFEIIDKLGSGSFGTVYKVKRKLDGDYYVIKKIRIADMSYDEQVNAINEVKLLSQIDSEYVVRYYDSFLSKDSLHIVMEYCNKGDVQSLLKKAKSKGLNSLREALIWNVGIQIMLGLYYLHKKKILHRDLKAANVFLSKHSTEQKYNVKIGDLGVAKLLETSTAFAQTIIGTPYYLSPELCADQPYRDKSDCWALGVVFYECCTLQHPFDAKNQCALILKIIQSPVPQISSELHNVSPPLIRLVYWLLEKDPNRRPSIKAILCEKFVREQIFANGFELPIDLLNEPITNFLNPDVSPVPSASVSSRTTSMSASRVLNGKDAKSPLASNSQSKDAQPLKSGVRGDRVRGGQSKITSSAARERYQIKPPPITRQTSGKGKSSDDKSDSISDMEVEPSGPHKMAIIDDESIVTLPSKSGIALGETLVRGKGLNLGNIVADAKRVNDVSEASEEEKYEEDFEVFEEDDEITADRKVVDPRVRVPEGTYEVDSKAQEEGLAFKRIQSVISSSSRDNTICAVPNDESDEYDVNVLQGLIDEFREKSHNLLGEKIFHQVYDLCSQYMTVDLPKEDGDSVTQYTVDMSTEILQNLEKTICHQLGGAGIEVVCEAVFNVKLLLALESRLKEQLEK